MTEAQGPNSHNFHKWEDRQIAAEREADAAHAEAAEWLGDTRELEAAAATLAKEGIDPEQIAELICEGAFTRTGPRKYEPIPEGVYEMAHERLMDAMKAAKGGA